MGSSSLIAAPASALFDSNILIDFLLGIEKARHFVAACDHRAISTITAIEVLAGAVDSDWPRIRTFLSDFIEIPLDAAVRDESATLRRASRLKLPDAIIWATARVHRLPLVTRNSRDFPPDDPTVITPYTLP